MTATTPQSGKKILVSPTTKKLKKHLPAYQASNNWKRKGAPINCVT
jgi:hypothetical protein